MKLSNKLLIGLLGIVMLLIIVQIYLSKDVATDLEWLPREPSYEELKAVKTFEVFEFADITTLNLNNQESIIRKGDRFEVFYQPIVHNKPKIKDGALFVNGREISRDMVYIYMPDLQSLNLTNCNARSVRLYDFNGQDIHVSVENGERTHLVTNMSRFNLSGKHADIWFHNFLPMDSLQVSLTNSAFRILDLWHPINNLDINLEKSNFDLELRADTLLKNVKIKGSVAKYNKQREAFPFYYYAILGITSDSNTLVCDTLDIDIVSLNTDRRYRLDLPSNIKSQHYSVKTSDNIEVSDNGNWQRNSVYKSTGK